MHEPRPMDLTPGPFLVWEINGSHPPARCYVCHLPTSTRVSLASTPTLLWAVCLSHTNQQAADVIRHHQET